MRVIVFITFYEPKTMDMNHVTRTVLSKFYLKTLYVQAYKMLASIEKRVVLTSMPRVMVKASLKITYLRMSLLVPNSKLFEGATLASSSNMSCSKAKDPQRPLGENKVDAALLNPSNPRNYLFISHCK